MRFNSIHNKVVISLCVVLFSSLTTAMEVPIYDFSIAAYSQNASDYLSPQSDDYTQSILTKEYQQSQLKRLYAHTFGQLSPWDEGMVRAILPIVKKMEPEVLAEFDNQNKSTLEKRYAENFKEHDLRWWENIKQNMSIDVLDLADFNVENRAIAIANTHARALPDMAPDFFHATIAGQGFPFDNLQESAVWVGTPLYVFMTSRDKAWSLVLTPEGYFAWVKSADIAYASSEFIHQWQEAAQKKLTAITRTQATIADTEQQYQFTAYIGSIFPLAHRNGKNMSILIPRKNSHNQAVINVGVIDKQAIAIMPMRASKKNIAKILKQLQNRPYGWGGAYFFNDCSQEMKSIFTPLAIWLPRNSAMQAKLNSTIDLSSHSENERLNILRKEGHPLMTMIYIGGHVMLYIGKKNDSESITYQNIWGLSPLNRDKRYVIGQSVFFPLLKSYPENPDVSSLANKPIFKLIYLDTLDSGESSPQAFAKSFISKQPYPSF